MQLARFLVQRRVVLFFISLIICVLLGFQIPRLALTGDFKVLFSEDNIYLQTLESIEEEFLESDSLVFLIEPNGGSIYTVENLMAIESMTRFAWQLPYSMRVDSLVNYQRTNADEDSLTVEYFIESAEVLTNEDIVELQSYAAGNAFLSNLITNLKGSATAVVVSLVLPDGDRMEILEEVAVAARNLRSEMERLYPGTRIYISGGVFLEQSFIEIIKHDLGTLMPFVLVICFVIIGVLLRSLSAIVVTSSIIITSVIVCMGGAALVGTLLTPTSVMAPLMVIVLAMADAIHLLTHLVNNRGAGMSQEDALLKSLQANIKPIFLTSITTAIGFLGMNFSASPAFHAFGNIAAFGVMGAFVLSMTLFPALVLWLPSPKPKPSLHSALMDILATFSIRQSDRILIIFLVGIVVVVSFIPQNKFNDSITAYFDEEIEFRQAIEFGNKHLSSVQHIIYSINSGEEGAINEPEYLTVLDDFSKWYREQEGVTNVFSYVDIIKNINQAMHGNDPAWKVIPENRELISQFFLMYELSLPQGFDIDKDINTNRSGVRLMVSMKKSDNQTLADLHGYALTWFEKNAPQYKVEGSSRTLMFTSLGEVVTKSMIGGSAFAFILITLTLIVGLGSFKYGFISLIPNLFPAAIIYGLWGIFIKEVNMVAAMTFSISIGLVVDDTVHFLSKYIESRRRGETAEEGIRYAFHSAGSALVITTFAISIGMSTLLLSHFGPMVTAAQMLCPIIIIALVLDLLFLPACLIMFDRIGLVAWKLQLNRLFASS